MRITVQIPDALMHKALHTSKAKTKTMVIVLGLQEIIRHHELSQLRRMVRRGMRLTVDLDRSRERSRG